MKNNMKKNTIGLLLLAILIFANKAAAFQKSKVDIGTFNDFVVEPGKTEIFLNPGESAVKNITITNRIDRTVKFILTTEDMAGTNDPKTPVKLLGDEKGPYSLKNLIVPEISEFTLEKGEKIVIPVTVTVPIDAEPRGYYGALVVSNEPEVFGDSNTTETEAKTRFISRIGSLFLLRINGEGKESGYLDNFKIIGPSKVFYQERPKGFEVSFKNDGNVHLVPHGKITIKNMTGKNVGEIPVDAYFALPDSLRYREVYWTEGTGLGRYTATISLYKGYGSESDNDVKTIAFWIIPWKTLAIGFAGIFVLVSLIYYILTRFELKKK